MIQRIYRIGSYSWERYYPLLFGLSTFAVFARYGYHLLDYGNVGSAKPDNWYGPSAGVFAIITGFLASFYGSIQSLADTRLKRIARSSVFRRFISQIKEATIAGFVLSVCSVPFIIIAPSDVKEMSTRLVIATWMGGSVYSIATFVRVGRMLFYVFEVELAEDTGAR